MDDFLVVCEECGWESESRDECIYTCDLCENNDEDCPLCEDCEENETLTCPHCGAVLQP